MMQLRRTLLTLNFQKSLRAFLLKLRGAAFQNLTQLWYS